MRRKTTYKKESAAVLLLVLILFIHVVKIYHSHESTRDLDWQSGIVKIEKADTCLICDYHITKESYETMPVVKFIKQSHLVSYPILYTSRTVTSTGLSFSDRGPPATA